jgi:hypothetical protein
MKRTFDQIIENSPDLDLCVEIDYALIDKYGNDVDPKKYAKEARVVMLSLYADGVIRNGGFGYLFEGDVPGDPWLRNTVEAFETLGVKSAAAAFKKALAIFPNSRPPKDIEKRLSLYVGVPFSRRQKIDEMFWNAGDEITTKVAQYIRDNRDVFRDLKLRNRRSSS